MSRQATTTMACGGGFSLVEVLIAIGVLGVGLAMVMLVFPAAVMENRSSSNSTIGTIMCENALGLAQAKLKHDGSITTSMTKRDAEFSADELKYTDSPPRGTFVLAKRESPTSNMYLIISIAYQTPPGATSLNVVQLTGATLQEHEGQFVKISGGSPTLDLRATVIASNGRSSIVTSVDGATAILKSPLRLSGQDMPDAFFVLVNNTNPADPKPLEAMHVMVTRMPLKE